MIKSMTGFASASAAAGGLTVGIEIRTYNSRNLDIALRLPAGYSDLEERARSVIAARLTRGRIEARVHIEDVSDSASPVEVDMARARAVFAALQHLKTELGLEGAASLELVVGVGGVLKTVQPKADLAAAWSVLEGCLAQALDGLDAMRSAEGRHLAVDLGARLDALEAAIGEDQVDWSAVFALCEGQGKTEWFIVEHESSKDPLDAVKRCFAGLKQLGKV